MFLVIDENMRLCLYIKLQKHNKTGEFNLFNPSKYQFLKYGWQIHAKTQKRLILNFGIQQSLYLSFHSTTSIHRAIH